MGCGACFCCCRELSSHRYGGNGGGSCRRLSTACGLLRRAESLDQLAVRVIADWGNKAWMFAMFVADSGHARDSSTPAGVGDIIRHRYVLPRLSRATMSCSWVKHVWVDKRVGKDGLRRCPPRLPIVPLPLWYRALVAPISPEVQCRWITNLSGDRGYRRPGFIVPSSR
jgi:hypothetical protein